MLALPAPMESFDQELGALEVNFLCEVPAFRSGRTIEDVRLVRSSIDGQILAVGAGFFSEPHHGMINGMLFGTATECVLTCTTFALSPCNRHHDKNWMLMSSSSETQFTCVYQLNPLVIVRVARNGHTELEYGPCYPSLQGYHDFAIGASAPRLLPWHRTHAHSGFCKPGVAGCGACHEWPFVLMSIFPLTTIPTPCHRSVPRIPISDLCACGFHLRAVPEWP